MQLAKKKSRDKGLINELSKSALTQDFVEQVELLFVSLWKVGT